MSSRRGRGEREQGARDFVMLNTKAVVDSDYKPLPLVARPLSPLPPTPLCSVQPQPLHGASSSLSCTPRAQLTRQPRSTPPLSSPLPVRRRPSLIISSTLLLPLTSSRSTGTKPSLQGVHIKQRCAFLHSLARSRRSRDPVVCPAHSALRGGGGRSEHCSSAHGRRRAPSSLSRRR